MPANCNELSGGCTITTLGSGFQQPVGRIRRRKWKCIRRRLGQQRSQSDDAPIALPQTRRLASRPLAGTFSAPIGVTLDGNGNLYVADNGNNAVREIPRATAPATTFSNVVDGSTGTAQTVTTDQLRQCDAHHRGTVFRHKSQRLLWLQPDSRGWVVLRSAQEVPLQPWPPTRAARSRSTSLRSLRIAAQSPEA